MCNILKRYSYILFIYIYYIMNININININIEKHKNDNKKLVKTQDSLKKLTFKQAYDNLRSYKLKKLTF
jgi:hypothetical protein